MELQAAVALLVAGVGAVQGGDVARLHLLGPAGYGAAVGVHDHVDVHLGGLGADEPGGVGAHRVAPVVAELAPAGVPVGAGRQVGQAVLGEGEDELEPLVEAVVGELVQVVAGEGHPQERRAQPFEALHSYVEHAKRLGHPRSLPSRLGEANLKDRGDLGQLQPLARRYGMEEPFRPSEPVSGGAPPWRGRDRGR